MIISLVDLEQLGVLVEVEGDDLSIDAPEGVLTPDLVQELKESKLELMTELALGRGVLDVLNMPFSEFAYSGRCLEVYSRVLDERVMFAANNADVPNVEMVVYKPREMAELAGYSPGELKAAHAVRKAFDGELLENAPDGVEIPSEIFLPGVAGDLYAVIAAAPDDGELEVICAKLDKAYTARELNDRTLKLLTDAVSKRAEELEAADDIEP